jgi:hypothetical protein
MTHPYHRDRVGYNAPSGSYAPTELPEDIHNLTSESVTEYDGKKESHEQSSAIAGYLRRRHQGQSTDDEGHVGQHQNDVVMLHNAHPHQSHSVGYHTESPRHTRHENHMFESVHITHHKRDKAPEHHPPKGLMVHGAVDHARDTETVFG